MASILLSMVSGMRGWQLPCFYEGFADALKREGNQVMIMITNCLLSDYWSSNETRLLVDRAKLDRCIQAFGPDLVVSFNHSMYESVPNLVDCPIVVWTSDSPVYFGDVDALRNNIDRYHVVCVTEHFVEPVKSRLNAPPSRIHVIPPATDFVAEDIPQDKNISFIGTRFSCSERIKECLLEEIHAGRKQDLRTFLDAFNQDVLKKPQEHLSALDLRLGCLDDTMHQDLLNLMSGNFRAQVLASLSDLDLHIFGTRDWFDVIDHSVDLALCYDEREVFSAKHNQDIYNSSKININASHIQARGGMPWRICDIMATNGVLVTDQTSLPDISKYFGRYVAIPFYETPYEARQVCKRLLSDEEWRREIVQASQLAIEEGHRFRHRLKDLQGIVGTDLFPGGEGEITTLDPQEFYTAQVASEPILLRARRRLARLFRLAATRVGEAAPGGWK